jgi:hypothetical protein
MHRTKNIKDEDEIVVFLQNDKIEIFLENDKIEIFLENDKIPSTLQQSVTFQKDKILEYIWH